MDDAILERAVMGEIETDHVSILLDIKSEVGALNARMLDAAHSRQRMETNIDELKEAISDIKPVVAVVAQIKPEHDDLMRFRDRIGGYVWLGGAIAAGAFWLLWQGVMFFAEQFKTGAGKLIH